MKNLWKAGGLAALYLADVFGLGRIACFIWRGSIMLGDKTERTERPSGSRMLDGMGSQRWF